MAFTKASYVGQGEVYLAKRTAGVPGKPRFFGNASKLELSIETDTLSVINFTGGGGEWDSSTSIKAVKMSLAGTDFTPENIELAIRGVSSAVTAGAVTDEAHVAYLDAPVFFNNIPDLTVAPVVKSTDASPVTYVKDTDYTVTTSGIIPITGGAITEAQDLEISYTKKAAIDIQSLVSGDDEYEVRYIGRNTMKNDRRYFVKLFIVKFSPTAGFPLIGNTPGELTFEGSVIADATITGTGLSKFFVEKIEN